MQRDERSYNVRRSLFLALTVTMKYTFCTYELMLQSVLWHLQGSYIENIPSFHSYSTVHTSGAIYYISSYYLVKNAQTVDWHSQENLSNVNYSFGVMLSAIRCNGLFGSHFIGS